MNARFLAIAQDPAIIHGVHHHCDEWCDQCAVTHRCLCFRCTAAFRKQHGRVETDATFASLEEAIDFTRELAAIDGSPTDLLDGILASQPGQSGLETSDPLAAVAWDYAVNAAFLFTRESMTLVTEGAPAGEPGAEEIVLWHHVRIYMKLVRALVDRERSTGSDALAGDADGCAKLVLVSIARSRAALKSLESADHSAAIDRLIAALDELQRGVDERFPLARRYVRAGIDCPVA